MTEEPGAPEDSEESTDPEVKEEPTTSEDTKTPGDLTDPEEPIISENPETPAKPEDPAVTKTPEEPENTDVAPEVTATDEELDPAAAGKPKAEEAEEDVPDEVQTFLDAADRIPANITAENLEEAGELVNAAMDAYEALRDVAEGTYLEREDVQDAYAEVEAAFMTVQDIWENGLGGEKPETFDTGNNQSLFSKKYNIYDQNYVYELDCRTINLNINVGVGETWVDEGYMYVWDKSYGTYKVTSWNDISIYSTDTSVLSVSYEKFRDGKLKITYTGISDGKADVKLAFNAVTHGTGDSIYNSPDMPGAAAVANCTMTGISVGTGVGNGDGGSSGTKPGTYNKEHTVYIPVGATMDMIELYLTNNDGYVIDVKDVVNYTSDKNVAVITGGVENGGWDYDYCDIVTPEITGIGPGKAEVYCTYSNSLNRVKMIEKFTVVVYEPTTVTVKGT